MQGTRLRAVATFVGFALLTMTPLAMAGAGVFRLLAYNDRVSHGANDAAVVSEQIQVMAVVAAEAAVPGANIETIRATGLKAGLKTQATMDRLLRSGLERGEVVPLNRRLREYFASLELADNLYGQDGSPDARRMAADTARLVPPISALSNTLVTEFQYRADNAAHAARINIFALLLFAVGSISGVTLFVERRRRHDAVRTADYEARAHFEAMVEHSNDVLLLTDESNTVTYVSPAVTGVLGYTSDEWVGRTTADLIDPADHAAADAALLRVINGGSAQTLDLRIRHGDGSWRTMEVDITPLSGDARSVLWTCGDVSTKREMEIQLRRQAFEDALTGLANRALLQDRLRQAMMRSSRVGDEVAVLLLDLDNFKEINDGFGHPAGDAVLVDVAARLLTAVREGDTVARLGGDEFIIVAEASGGLEMALDLAERVRALLRGDFSVAGTDVRLTASIGVVLVSGNSNVDEVIRDADVAMYQAKAMGRDTMAVFETQMLDHARARVELTNDLERALGRGELELFYQPIYRLTTSQVVGAEALLRWWHPQRGLIPPDVFIPIAERSGAIIDIGRWVLHEAVRQAQQWAEVAPGVVRSMHVNISAHQLVSPSFVADVAEVLRTSGLDPEVLVLELTESIFMADTTLPVRRLGALRELGVRVAIDDFGTGYSSLARLAELPVDIVKIDRSFLTSATDGVPHDRTLLSGICAMTDGLHLTTIAEGIERETELESLKKSGCDLGQGFLLGRPVSAPQFPLAAAALSA